MDRLLRLKQRNLHARAQRNVAHHFNLDEWLYALFLDSEPAIQLRLLRCDADPDDHQGTVPITRANIGGEDLQLRRLEGGRRPPMRLAGE